MTRRPSPWLVASLVVVLAFLVMPIVAVFVAIEPGDLVRALGSDAVGDALRVSLVTNLVAQLLVVAVGTPAAYLIAKGVPLRPLVVALVEVPLVLPPAVAGLGLVFTFGRPGFLGGIVDDAGLQIALTQAAVIIAIAYVSSPFYIRAAITAFEGVDRGVVDAARTLGARPVRVFWKVMMPLASGGLMTGAALALARGLGEFGATFVFAGNLPGSTQTMPLAVYEELNANNESAALAIGAILILASLAILLGAKVVDRWRR